MRKRQPKKKLFMFKNEDNKESDVYVTKGTPETNMKIKESVVILTEGNPDQYMNCIKLWSLTS